MKDLKWIGSSRKDLKEFPNEVIDEMGHALHLAQMGERHKHAKTFSGCGSATLSRLKKAIDRGLIEWFIPLKWTTSFLYYIHFRKSPKAA
jgi:phage-related protein